MKVKHLAAATAALILVARWMTPPAQAATPAGQTWGWGYNTYGQIGDGLNGDGSFAYTPAADFTGMDSFTHEAHDGQTNSDEATVTITVNPVNDPPVAADDAYETDEDTPLVVAGPRSPSLKTQLTTEFAQGIAIGDVDNDGGMDLVVAAPGSNQILAFDGNGQLKYAVTFAERPRAVLIVDLDGNSRNELVVAASAVNSYPAIHCGAGSDSGGRLYVGEVSAAGFGVSGALRCPQASSRAHRRAVRRAFARWFP